MSLLNQSFEAYAIHPDNGNELAHGEISFSTQALKFQAAEITWEILSYHLVAEVRVGDEERITLTDPTQPGLEIFVDDFSLLDRLDIPALAQARTALTARLQKREINRRLKILAYCLAAIVVITWFGGVATKFMVRSIAARVPASWDQRFGSNAMAEFRAEEKFIDDTNAIARLAEVAQPLLRVLPKLPNGYQFHIVDDEEVNACALPGGHIVVNTGLLKTVDRPEQLLGVIAHEMAHVTERHAYRHEISMAGPFMVFKLFLGSSSSSGAILSGGTAILLNADFSQDFENEADAKGWDYLVAANIDPRGMVEMFEKFKKLSDEDAQFLPQSLQSHPSLNKRIERLQSKWSKLKFKAGFVVLDSAPILKP